MNILNISLKKILIYYLIFVLSNLTQISSLNAMMEDKDTYESRTLRVVLLEDMLPTPFEENYHRSDSDLPYISRSNSLERIIDFQNSGEDDLDEVLISGLSNSYVAAFQKELDEGISRSEALRYLICLIGGIGPFIPQIAIAKTIADNYDSELLGYTLIAASAISIEAITSWMIWELIDDAQSLIKLAKQNRRDPSTCDCNLLKSIAIGFTSLVLGVLSSAPDVYIKYKYNDIKWFALISLIYDSIPRVIGFYKFFSSLELEKIKKIFKGPSIEECQATKITNISQAYFLQKCKEDGINSVSETLSNFTLSSEIYSYLTSNRQIDFAEEEAPQDCAKGLPRKGVQYSSLLLPIASALFNTAMAYQGFKLIVKDETALFFLSTFSVMPAFILSSYVVKQASENVFDKIYLCRSRAPSTDYFHTFYPKLNIAILSSALLLASVTSFTSFNIIADNLDDTILDPIKYGIAVLAIGTDFTFGIYTIYSTFKRYGEAICRKASKGASYVINCTKKIGGFASSISSFSSNILNRFVRDTVTEEES